MPPFSNQSSGRGRNSNTSQRQLRNTRNQPQKEKRRRETRQRRHQKTLSSQHDAAAAGATVKDLPPAPSSDLFADLPTPTRDNIARAQALHAK